MVEGSEIDSNESHALKTLSPRVVMLFGRVIDFNDENP